jgi:hypothetical protein
MSKSATLSCIGRKSHVQTTCSLTSVLLVVPRELYTSYPAHRRRALTHFGPFCAQWPLGYHKHQLQGSLRRNCTAKKM